MSPFKIAFSIFGVLALFFAAIFFLGWAIEGNDFVLYKTFAPKYEQARRETFEQSKSYNDGVAQELSQMELDYLRGNVAQKTAIASMVLHRVAGYDTSKLNSDLQEFVATCRHNQGL